MADATILARRHLLGDADLVTLLGGEFVFGGELPAGFDPTLHPAVTISSEWGQAHPEAPITQDRLQVRTWAGANQHVLARVIYEQVFHRLHQHNNIDLAPDGFILILQESVRGQDGTDPETGWATVLSFYEITARDSSTEEVETEDTFIVDGGSF